MIERRAWDRIGSLTDVASRVMLSFGEFEFSIDSAAYNAMKRTMEWRWDEQQLIGKKDLLQYTDNTTSFLPGGAPKNKTFTLELKYYGEKLADH
ncbi:hypothetical protein COOONC_04327 [Cooperia oncophora]